MLVLIILFFNLSKAYIINAENVFSENAFCANVPLLSVKLINATWKLSSYSEQIYGSLSLQRRDYFDLLCQRRCLGNQLCSSAQTYIQDNQLICDFLDFNPCTIPEENYSITSFSYAFNYCTTQGALTCSDPHIWICTRSQYAGGIDDCLSLWSHVITLKSSEECHYTVHGEQKTLNYCTTVQISV